MNKRFGLLCYLAIGYLFCLADAVMAASPITWTPSSVAEKVTVGNNVKVIVSFVATENLDNVNLVVVPELQPMVSLSASSFARITKGQTIALTMTISGRSGLLGTFAGTVQLKDGGKPRQTYSMPLPVTVTVTSEARAPLVTKTVPLQFPILQDHNLPLGQLTVATMFWERTLNSGETIVDVMFVDTDKGQMLSVANPDGTPFLVAYVSASEIRSGAALITSDSIARGLIMMNPLMLGFKEPDRLAILEYAQTDALYQDLKAEIGAALQAEPRNLLQEAIFPRIYEYAVRLVIRAIQNAAPATTQRAYRAATTLAPVPTVGSATSPYLSDAPGAAILTVDPTMLFYGVDITGLPPQVIAGKESLWELHLGWPPAGYTEAVTETVNLGNGTFTVSFAKFGLASSAAMMASSANFLRVACDVVDVLAYCPASNPFIENVVEGNVLDALAQLVQDIFTNAVDPGEVLRRVVDKLLDHDVWRNVTEYLYASAADKQAAVTFLQNSKTVLKVLQKALLAYDAANIYIPFAWDLITKPNNLQFCVTQQEGVLSSTCQLVPPTAVINKLSPATVHVGDVVSFDASQSTDDRTSAGSLLVRWDFNGDGIFDTEWSTNKQATVSYSNAGAYTVRLEVKDTDGLVGQTVFVVVVGASTAKGTATHIKAFRDVLPWETTSFEQTVAANGYTAGPGSGQYEILPSSEFATNILVPGQDLVVIMNDQNQSFYNNLALAINRVERFIQNGGVVIWGASDLGWHNGSMSAAGITQLPGGVQYQYFYDVTNFNVLPESALMAGLPSVLTGTYASHEHFTITPPGAVIYMKDTIGYPTLIEYKENNGWVLLSGQPLEYNVVYNPESMGLVYSRLLGYVLGSGGGTATMAPLAPTLQRAGPVTPSHLFQ